jgi:hypothetical protein
VGGARGGRGADGPLSSRRVVPHARDIARLVLEVAARCEAWEKRQGFGADEEVSPEEDDSLSLQQQVSVGGTVAVEACSSEGCARGGRLSPARFETRRIARLSGPRASLPRVRWPS